MSQLIFTKEAEPMLEELFGLAADLDLNTPLVCGQRVRAFDFPINKPIAQWMPRYVDGTILEINGDRVKIYITARIWDGEAVRYLPKEEEHRWCETLRLAVFPLKRQTGI